MESIIDYRGKTPRKTNSGIPLITAKIVKNGRINPPEEFIDPGDFDNWMRRGLPRKGDVIMTTEAPLGEIAQLHISEVALAQRVVCFHGKSGLIENSFLKFLMQSPFIQQELEARSTGTTVLGIRRNELRDVTLVVPPIKEQHAITSILGALDDKIELNRKMNRTLEEMAKALFKSWFVDFDPVRAKMEGRKPFGMDGTTIALFPNQFVDSELGPIPEGWNIASIADLLELKYGKALKENDRRPGTVPVYGSNGQIGLHNKKLVAGPGIVVGRKGNPGIVTLVHDDFFPIDTTFYVEPKKSEVGLYYLFHALGEQHLGLLASDSAVPGLNRNNACLNRLVLPSTNVLHEFHRDVESLYERVAGNLKQSTVLTDVRDTLLPKLLSGQIRIKDAEKFVGEGV